MEIPQTFTEGSLADMIESKASAIPDAYYFWIGLGLVGASLFLRAIKRKQAAQYIGRLATPILIMGVYHKLIHHSEQSATSTPPEAANKK